MKGVLVLVAMCLAFAVAQNNPITRIQFTASYQETMTISTSGSSGFPSKLVNSFAGNALAGKRGLGDISITDSGTLNYDGINRRMRQDVSSVTFDFGTGPTTQQVSITSLMLYDLAKNYTWDSDSCDCLDLTELEIPILYLTPELVASANPTQTTITVSGTTYSNVDLYSSTMEFGGTSQTINFYVNGQDLIRTTYDADYGYGVTANYQFDMWSVKNLTATTSVFTPNSNCKCPVAAPAALNTTTSFPTACGTLIDGCQCVQGSSIDTSTLFCKDYLTYQIDANTFVYFTDNFVKSAYQQTLDLSSGASDTCKTQLQSFYCHFYFPQCQNDATLKPTQPDFSGCGSSFTSNDAYNTYEVADNTNKGSSSGTSSASTLVASFVAAAALAVAAF